MEVSIDPIDDACREEVRRLKIRLSLVIRLYGWRLHLKISF